MNKGEILKIIDSKLTDKIKKLDLLITETRASNNDTKSSMGDKYETSREMVQQEINNLQIQLNENIKAKNSLKLINVKPHQIIGLGSLVKTDKGLFFIAVSLGEIIYNKEKVFVISTESPLAKIMSGLKQDEIFQLNTVSQTVKKVL